VIGRIGLEKRPVIGFVGIAIFGDPARAGVQLRIAAHVDQRNGAEQGAEPLRIAHQHVGDENSAIRSTCSGNPCGMRDSPLHEVGRYGSKIIVRKPLAGPATDVKDEPRQTVSRKE
jgi:hypothetical protein